jgi:hypothetical protein
MIWTMRAQLEKVGGIGAVVAAAACPICFPKLALLGALFGFGAFGAYESQFFIAAQVMVVLAIAGHVLSYLRHRNGWLLGSAILSGVAVFAGLYWLRSELVAYSGFAGLVVTSATDFWTRFKREPSMARLESIITCPKCGASRKESMPTNFCLHFYDCTACGATLRPKAGDCCVFCSYGSVKCPSRQAAGAT